MQEQKVIELSIVIPVFNSAEILPTLISQLELVLTNDDISGFEVVLIDDASVDNSWEVIEYLSATKDYIKGLNLRRNIGHHNAIIAGLNHTIGKVIVLMDDDLQHSPSDVPKLFSKVVMGYDVCFANFKIMRHVWWKRLGSYFNDLVANFLIKKPKNVHFSSFKAFSSDIKDEVIKFSGPFAYLDAIIFLTTSNIICVEVEHHDRYKGHGNYTFRKAVSLWLKMATGFSLVPLRLASILGFVTAMLGFVFAVIVIILKLSGNMEIPIGWTSLAIIVLVLGGIQLIAIGVIGEYLGRAYISLNNVPVYSIKKKINL